MIKTKLLHPQILKSLASAGHGSKILISDGNFPHTTGSNPDAEHVFLNLAPGYVTVPDVLKVLVETIPIEAAEAISPPLDEDEPPVFADYREILPDDLEVQKIQRFDFYDAARDKNVALVIATGEPRTWACILLTIGVIFPE